MDYKPDMIKAMRKEKGLTQKQLGEKCGMKESQIRKYELGNGNPKLETLERIADALNEPVHIFLQGDLTKEYVNKIFPPLTMEVSLEGPDGMMIEKIIQCFYSLNAKGKEEAQKRIEELLEISRYVDSKE